MLEINVGFCRSIKEKGIRAKVLIEINKKHIHINF